MNEEDFYKEPLRVYGKHRFMAGTCVDCGHPLDKICSANLDVPEPVAEDAIVTAFRAGFNQCRYMAMNIVDEHDGFLNRIESLEPDFTVNTEKIPMPNKEDNPSRYMRDSLLYPDTNKMPRPREPFKRADNGDPDTIVPAPAPHKKHPGYPK